jgi:hypothetical protein
LHHPHFCNAFQAPALPRFMHISSLIRHGPETVPGAKGRVFPAKARRTDLSVFPPYFCPIQPVSKTLG